jgi:hypothetical protein
MLNSAVPLVWHYEEPREGYFNSSWVHALKQPVLVDGPFWQARYRYSSRDKDPILRHGSEADHKEGRSDPCLIESGFSLTS